MRHYFIALILFVLCFAVVSNSCLAQSNALTGIWDKVSGPGDPIRYTFLPDSKVLIHFQTSVDTATYLTFPIYSSSLGTIGLGQDGAGFWQGIYDVSSDTLKVEGFWHTGLPPTPTPTFFNTPTSYRRVPTDIITGENETSESFFLHHNYPNPFNPSTTISFSLSRKSIVSLDISDALGRKVAVLASEELPAGTYTRQWNAEGLASGVYYYRLTAGDLTQTKKLILLR